MPMVALFRPRKTRKIIGTMMPSNTIVNLLELNGSLQTPGRKPAHAVTKVNPTHVKQALAARAATPCPPGNPEIRLICDIQIVGAGSALAFSHEI